MPLASATDAPAWFGKIAGLGDFASRRLAARPRETLDAWLAAGLAASRGELGERWLNLYLTSPIWWFALAPEVVDAQWWFGVLMPSVDNVGRYYPLLIVQARTEGPLDAVDLAGLTNWFEAASVAALATLQDRADVDSLERDLAALRDIMPAPAPRWTDAKPLPWRDRLDGEVVATWSDVIARACLDEAHASLRGRSLWWPRRDAAGPRSLSISTGLPPPEAYARLLEGDW